MKRILAFILVLVLALSFCACQNEEPNSGKKRAPSKQGTPALTPTPTDAPDITVTPSPTPTPKPPVVRADKSVLPLTFYAGTADKWLPYGEEALLRIAGPRFTYAFLNDEGCQAGLNAFTEFIDSFKVREDQILKDYEAKTGWFEGNGPTEGSFGITYVPEIIRTDTNVISAKVIYNAKLDGFTGESVFPGSFDAKTGKALTLKDLVLNETEFFQIVAKQLRNDENDARLTALGTESELLSKLTALGASMRFVVNYEGITVFFNPGELATSELGMYSTTVFFDDHQDVFLEKYFKVPENYGIGTAGAALAIDGVMNGNLILRPEFDMYGYYTKIGIELWTTDATGKLQLLCNKAITFDVEDGIIYASPYYVRCGGKDYVMLGTIGSSDHIYVYELNRAAKTLNMIDETPGYFDIQQRSVYAQFDDTDEFSALEPELLETTYLDLKSLDPTDFIILTKGELISCMNLANLVTFGTDGKLYLKSDIRPIQNQFQFRGDLKAPLKGLEVLDLDTYRSRLSYTPGTQTISLEAGRNYIPLAFLGVDKLILFYMDPNGAETNQYIMVTLEENGGTVTCDGVPIFDIFVNLFENY